LEKGFHVKRKTEQAAESGKGQRGRAGEEEKLEVNGICRINSGKGGLSSINGYYGIICNG
jgi:hypothetical protein